MPKEAFEWTDIKLLKVFKQAVLEILKRQHRALTCTNMHAWLAIKTQNREAQRECNLIFCEGRYY